MSYGETKVYFDGSHYIAIPHTTRNVRKRPKPVEERITVIREQELEDEKIEDSFEPSISSNSEDIDITDEVVEENKDAQIEPKIKVKTEHQMTRKELFEELYLSYLDMPRKVKKEKIYNEMRQYFKTDLDCRNFVEINFDRKLRNIICRRVRMVRKANLQNFNYFCTFTYDDNKQTEFSFRKKLMNAFSHFTSRKGWRYIGVWERSPKNKRLHFHGMFHIPDGTMPGELIEKREYNFTIHDMKTTYQNTYFNDRYGRSDFELIEDKNRIGDSIRYLLKYIEKTGEKIVYSRGLYQYFISDIMDDDIVTTIGQEDKKLLLFDDFNCWDEGVLMGKVSPEVISQMRKCN